MSLSESLPKKREPLLAAAVLKLSIRLASDREAAALQFVYDGVLRDCALSDAAVDDYIDKNRAKVLKAMRGKERGEP